MYKIAKLTPTQVDRLKHLNIDNQETIKMQTGQALDLYRVYLYINDITGHFKKTVEQAVEIDTLFWDFLQKEGFVKGEGMPKSAEKKQAPKSEKSKEIKAPKRILGKRRAITLPNGEKHDAQYAIVELNSMLASHDEETFGDTPGYPRNMLGGNLNDRNYATDKAAQQLVEDYAKNLNPDLLIALTSTPEGTPIITPEGFVVSGNNRTMSLKLAAKKYPAKYQAYQSALKNELDSFGFSKQDAQDLDELLTPVLVRIDYDFGEITTTNMAKYNASAMKAKNPIDRAFELSTTLREQVLCETRIPEQISEFDTLVDFYKNANATKKMVDALRQCNVLNDQDMPAIVNNGLFTEEGKTLVERVLSASALEPEVVRCADRDGVRALRQAVVYALPVIMQHKAITGEANLLQDINKAVCWQSDLVSSGLSFADFISQGNLFGDNTPSRRALALNRLMASGQRRFKDAIGKYTESQRNADGATMFADAVVSHQEAFEGYIWSALKPDEQQAIEKATRVQSGMAEVKEKIEKARPTFADKKSSLQARLKLLQLLLSSAKTDDKKTLLNTRIKIITLLLRSA